MKIGTGTKLHTVSGSGLRTLGQTRCYTCHRIIFIKVGEKIKDFNWEGNFYCFGCYQQVSHGIKVEVSRVSSWWRTCAKDGCDKRIGRIYKFCYPHSPAYNPNHIPAKKSLSEEVSIELRKKTKRDTTFGTDGNLRSDLAFCQLLDCPDKKPLPRKEMIKCQRRASGEITLRFCSQECADKYMNQEENKFALYRVWK